MACRKLYEKFPDEMQLIMETRSKLTKVDWEALRWEALREPRVGLGATATRPKLYSSA
jgi:hypothetical protein